MKKDHLQITVEITDNLSYMERKVMNAKSLEDLCTALNNLSTYIDEVNEKYSRDYELGQVIKGYPESIPKFGKKPEIGYEDYISWDDKRAIIEDYGIRATWVIVEIDP